MPSTASPSCARLETVETEGATGENLALEYAGQQRLLVPALDLARVWRYGAGEAEVGLDRLDGEAGQARRDEVAAQLAETAAALAGSVPRAGGVAGPCPDAAARRLRPLRAPLPLPAERGPGSRDRGDARRSRPRLAADGPAGLRRCRLRQDRGGAAGGRRGRAGRPAGGAPGADDAAGPPAPGDLPAPLRRSRTSRVEQLSRLADAAEARAVRAGLADGSVRGRRRHPCARVAAGSASRTSPWSSSTRSSASARARRRRCAGCGTACTCSP